MRERERPSESAIAKAERGVADYDLIERYGLTWFERHVRAPFTLALGVFTLLIGYGVGTALTGVQHDERDLKRVNEQLAAFVADRCSATKATNAHQAARWSAIATAAATFQSTSPDRAAADALGRIADVAEQAGAELKSVSQPTYCNPLKTATR